MNPDYTKSQVQETSESPIAILKRAMRRKQDRIDDNNMRIKEKQELIVAMQQENETEALEMQQLAEAIAKLETEK